MTQFFSRCFKKEKESKLIRWTMNPQRHLSREIKEKDHIMEFL